MLKQKLADLALYILALIGAATLGFLTAAATRSMGQ